MRSSIRSEASWTDYLDDFHDERPGITERILTRCRAGGSDPYRWCTEPLGLWNGPVVDVACGSGPVAEHVAGWLGLDIAPAELGVAAGLGRGPLTRGSASALPFRTGSAQAVSCLMALQVIDGPDGALAEVARVLCPGGRAVVLVPCGRPLPARDVLVYLRLQLVLGQRIRYPNDRALRLRTLRSHAEAVGLNIASDERRRFGLAVADEAIADDLVRSLYLPGLATHSFDAGRRVLHREIGRTLTVPLRRIVLDRREANR